MGSVEAAYRVQSGRAREEEWLWRRRARRELGTGEIGWARGVRLRSAGISGRGRGWGASKKSKGYQ